MTKPIEALLTPVDAASVLGVKVNTLAKWRVQGAGPLWVAAGRCVRYRPRDLQTWLERRTRQSTAE